MRYAIDRSQETNTRCRFYLRRPHSVIDPIAPLEMRMGIDVTRCSAVELQGHDVPRFLIGRVCGLYLGKSWELIAISKAYKGRGPPKPPQGRTNSRAEADDSEIACETKSGVTTQLSVQQRLRKSGIDTTAGPQP